MNIFEKNINEFIYNKKEGIKNLCFIFHETMNCENLYNSTNDKTIPIIYSEYCKHDDLNEVLNDITELDRISIIFTNVNLKQPRIFLNEELLFKSSDFLDIELEKNQLIFNL